ncbi:MAG: hypothetical protein EYC70_04740 [Planctomycetota bacterium]|nr:MAG: hypothetical protein EYC70_04740 [Planctomycetota bacterium]
MSPLIRLAALMLAVLLAVGAVHVAAHHPGGAAGEPVCALCVSAGGWEPPAAASGWSQALEPAVRGRECLAGAPVFDSAFLVHAPGRAPPSC